MIASDFVSNVFLEATGKLPTFSSGSTKWLKILALANVNIDNWSEEPSVDWFSLYSPDYSIGSVTPTGQYTLPAIIRKISNQEGDVIRIIHTDGVAFTDYTIISSDRQKDFANGMRTFQDNYVTINGNKLNFNRAFASTDPQFGGSITVPAYLFASHLVNDSDVVPVDIPNWLVFATAASYDSTDVTRQNLVPRLEAKGNELMQVMKDNNGGQDSRIYQPWRPMGENWIDEAWSNY